MWTWLAENPEKSKTEYKIFCEESNNFELYHNCWACKEARYQCTLCPIEFPLNDFNEYNCGLSNSPYSKWYEATNLQDRQKAAIEMITLIKTTWKEEN